MELNGGFADSVDGVDAVKCGTYSAEVQNGDGGWVRFAEKGTPAKKNFRIAVPGSKISRIRFDGSGEFRSLVGEWTQKVRALMIHIL